jgi:hypothetical protein
MNLIKSISFALLFLGSNILFAQESTTEKKPKKLTHELGIQSNLLIKQLIPFGSNNNNTDNPYLFAYHLFNQKSNLGMRFHFGLVAQNITIGSLNNTTKSTINNFSGKIGIEKSKNLGKGFTFYYGADFMYSANTNKARNTQVSFDSTIIVTNESSTQFGGGLGCRLTYNITKKMSIGTESYLFYTKNSNLIVSTFVRYNDGFHTNESDRQSENSNTSITQLPTAIFLHFRF